MRKPKPLSKKVLRIAETVRACAEELCRSGYLGNIGGESADSTLAGGCGDVSAVLVEFLQAAGVDASFEGGEYDGDGHCWVRLPDGSVLDLTMTQFRPKAPKVYHRINDRLYHVDKAGEAALKTLSSWADADWRRRLRFLVRRRLK